MGIVGRDYLRKIGIDADWYYRPDRSGIAGYQFLTHNLHLTRVLVAAAKWSREQTAYALKETRTCYEFGARVLGGAIAVIPDAWLLFQRLPEGPRFPFLFELDRGTEYQTKFKERVKYRIFFIQSGRYTETFGTIAVVVVYLAVGPNATDRRQTMCRWTEELLREMAMGEWGEIFKFGGVSETELYSEKLFTETMWQVPYQKSLVSLFD